MTENLETLHAALMAAEDQVRATQAAVSAAHDDFVTALDSARVELARLRNQIEPDVVTRLKRLGMIAEDGDEGVETAVPA